MHLQFGRAHHGWLPALLHLDGHTHSFDVSYLPYDFVAELAEALSGVLAGPGTYVARLCEEPAEYEWRFRASDPSAVLFEVVSYPEGRGGRGETVGEAWGSPLDVVLPLWRGLRELESRESAERYRANWSGPFPSASLGRLSGRVAEARASSG